MTDSQRWFTFVLTLIGVWIIYLIGPVLVPFLIAFLLAYLINPLVVKLHRWHVPRVVSAAVVFLLVLAIIIVVLLNLVPALELQIANFLRRLPDIINWVQTTAQPWVVQKLGINIDLDTNSIRTELLTKLHGNSSNIAKIIYHTLFNSGYVLFDTLMNIILIPVVAIYLLVDWSKITYKTKLLLPMSPERRDIVADLVRQCGDVLAGFLRGQLMVMVSLAIYYSIALSIVGLDFALLLGVVIGTLSIVPYLGFITGLLIGLITVTIQYHQWTHLIMVLIAFGIGQVCESMVFSPLFIGDRIGLHPIAVIFAVLAGGKLFGFVGILLALPAAAVMMVFFRYIQQHYFSSEERLT